jgi:hypothetical protein
MLELVFDVGVLFRFQILLRAESSAAFCQGHGHLRLIPYNSLLRAELRAAAPRRSPLSNADRPHLASIPSGWSARAVTKQQTQKAAGTAWMHGAGCGKGRRYRLASPPAREKGPGSIQNAQLWKRHCAPESGRRILEELDALVSNEPSGTGEAKLDVRSLATDNPRAGSVGYRSRPASRIRALPRARVP